MDDCDSETSNQTPGQSWSYSGGRTRPIGLNSAAGSWIETDGSLIVRLQDDPPVFIKVLSWERGLAWGTHSGWVSPGATVGWDWQSGDHGLLFCSCRSGGSSLSPMDQFADRIPIDNQVVLRPYLVHQGIMLRLCASYPAANDLLMNCNLLWLLADAIHRHKVAWAEVSGLLRLKRHQIVSRLINQQVGRSHVGFLQKVHVEMGDETVLANLKRIVRDRYQINLFRHHWPIIPEKAFKTVLKLRSPAFSRCLGRYLASKGSVEWGAATDRVLLLWEELQKQARDFEDGGRALKQLWTLSSFEAMEHLHERWTGRLHEIYGTRLSDPNGSDEFPPPLIPGTGSIVPIHSTEQLFHEGVLLQHCIYSYRDDIAGGSMWAYSVFSPERATVAIVLRDVGFDVFDFKLSDNGEPGEASWRLVKAWLKAGNRYYEGYLADNRQWKKLKATYI